MQAMIITVYKNLEQVAELVHILEKKFEVYVHIDKKVPLDEIKKSGLKCNKHVKIYSLYQVNWGGMNHLRAILYLINEALNNKEITYFHIISGQDWPVKPIGVIYDFFENTNKVYLCCKRLTEMNKKRYSQVSEWQKNYFFMDLLDYKRIHHKIVGKLLIYLQKLLRIDRIKEQNINLAHGLVWGDIPREAIEECFIYVYTHPDFLVFLQYGYCSEEFFFQTILSNSKIWKDKITNENLRYILWKKKNNSYPAVLDMDDRKDILLEKYLFARKVEYPISYELLKSINEQF